jgi:DNA-binding LacI/PurR family transcriptional regulator
MNFHLNSGPDQPEELVTRFEKAVNVSGKKDLPLVVDSYNSIVRRIPNFTFKFMPNLFFIGNDNYKAGEKIGAYLASMGHKQIAYFNFGNSTQDLERFKGMESALQKLFRSGLNILYFHEELKIAEWTPQTYASIPATEKKRFLEGFSGLFKNHQFQMADPVEEVFPSLANVIYKDIFKKRMAPFFIEALKIKEITAWVGTGSMDTLIAAEFLKEQKINIPDKISLLGFRDNDITREYGITTYDFMDHQAGYLAAHCILGDIPIKKNRKGYVEYEGQIMVRKSVKAI